MSESMTSMLEGILRQTFVMAGAIFFVVRALSGIRALNRNRAFRSALPVIPLVLGVVWAVATAPADVSLYESVERGIWAGAVSMAFRKILGQTLLGDDPVLDAYRKVERHARMDEVHDGGSLGGPDGPRSLDVGEANERDG